MSATENTRPETDRPASWVIKRKDTGEVITELFGQDLVKKLNTAVYVAVPIQEHLGSLSNSKYKAFTIK